MNDFDKQRVRMVEAQLARRGIADPMVLRAFEEVSREDFMPPGMEEFAYHDSPLPIGRGQTISQPYIVALTAQALGLHGGERVLEVGTGSGYAAAILARIAGVVVTLERIPELAAEARERLARLGFSNVRVIDADGTLGWPAEAPYDAIAVAAAGPRVPEALLAQLAPGGRLVMPIDSGGVQTLARITRDDRGRFRQESLTDVRFVPLIGAQGFTEEQGLAEDTWLPAREVPERSARGVTALVREVAEPFTSLEEAPLGPLLERIGDARLVLLGEATHGTSEFYRLRARITRELIEKRGFAFVAAEADWPDAARVDDYVRGGKRRSSLELTPFTRFPTWMWRNREVLELVSWLREANAARSRGRVGFHGLDLYSLFTSIQAVLAYLDTTDPEAARVARHRYAALTPWQKNPAAYGQAVLAGRYQSSETVVVAALKDLLARRLDYARKDGERFFDAAQNARVVANAEHYYRSLYYGGADSWNLRDAHMFDTLRSLLAFYGPGAKGVVWAHNTHVGDARATEMAHRGELNLGQLCRRTFGDDVYSIGLGTDHGTVSAASGWGEPMQNMRITPARPGSYEHLFHETALGAFTLPLRDPVKPDLREELLVERLERAIGVIYRPETELASHYFQARLPEQFDELIWFDESRALTPLPLAGALQQGELPDTYPFGL